MASFTGKNVDKVGVAATYQKSMAIEFHCYFLEHSKDIKHVKTRCCSMGNEDEAES